MAHTRFGFHWNWDGNKSVLLPRCTDELGTVQPRLSPRSSPTRSEDDATTEALVISFICSMACSCSRRVRAAEQSVGTYRLKLRIFASCAVQTMQLFVASPARIRDVAPR